MTSEVLAGQISYKTVASSLDNCAISPHRKTGIGSWNTIRKVYRARDIMEAGIAKWKGILQLKFITLTSSDSSNSSKLPRHFEELIRRIRRVYDFNAHYAAIWTSEGNGVIHMILACKPYIPQSWLSRQWNSIHNSPIVDIRRMYFGRGLRSYLTPYLQGQSVRISQSWGWYRKGWSTRWRKFVNSQKIKYLFRIQKDLGARPPVYCYKAFQKWFYRSLIPVLFEWWLVANRSDEPFLSMRRVGEPLLDFKALMLERLRNQGTPIIEGTDTSIP